MKTIFDLSQLDWKLSGWVPYAWDLDKAEEISNSIHAEIRNVSAKVPGSVQHSLKEAGIIPDWNIGLNYRQCEWVENRHWVYEVKIPDEWARSGKSIRLNCRGLDYCGAVMVNGCEVSRFCGSQVPYVFDLTPHLKESGNLLRIRFECPPRWLGQFGRTSEMMEWKPRFNYTWDWTARLVQIGIWDDIYLEATDGVEIESFKCVTETDAKSSNGCVNCSGKVSSAPDATVNVTLSRAGKKIAEKTVSAAEFNKDGVKLVNVPVELWWCNLEGEQPLYDVECRLVGVDGKEQDKLARRVGFRQIEWADCEDAPKGADPWICVINGRKIFLQGANWTPVRPNFADVTCEDYRKRLEVYRDLGANVLRVWGGAFLEKECFYDICDEMGIMIWQEFPLSSSNMDCTPPRNQTSLDSMAEIAESFIKRRQRHVSLLLWCGGNELIEPEGYIPSTTEHPMIARLQKVVEENDPTRRFLVTSPSGPKPHADESNYGKGIHWDIHGPWQNFGNLDDGWKRYWVNDDSLIRSETGSPGASSAEIIRRTAGEYKVLPGTADNPLWARNLTWWVQWPEFVTEIGREPETLEEYVDWSQARQAKALTIAMESAKGRFPKCGGMLIWMGHDCYPCAANTAIIDFDGNPKPAALALKKIWHRKP